MNSGRLGFYVIALSVVANAVSIHTTKAALNYTTPTTMAAFGPLVTCVLLLFAGVWWRAAGWTFGGFEQLSVVSLWRWMRKRMAVVALAGALAGGANVLMQVTISRFGPELAAFLGNLTLVFLVLGGLMLGERVRLLEAAVMTLIFIGALLFSYRGGQFQWLAIALMTLVAIGNASKQITIRQIARSANLPTVMAGMSVGMAISGAIIGIATGTLAPLPAQAMGFGLLTSLIGGVIGMTLLYAGYGMIGVARGAPTDAMRPLAVLLIGLALGASWPSLVQTIGAALILLGSASLASLHRPTPRQVVAADAAMPPPPAAAEPVAVRP